MNKMSIDIGFAELVVEKAADDSPFREFYIYLRDKESGLIHQDIALVRQAMNENTGQEISDAVDCIVWSDCDTEDYTHKFVIDLYKHTEEE